MNFKRYVQKTTIVPLLIALLFLMACSGRTEKYTSPNGTNEIKITYDFASRPSVAYKGKTIWEYEGSGFNEEVFFHVDWISEDTFILRYDDESHGGKYAEEFTIKLN